LNCGSLLVFAKHLRSSWFNPFGFAKHRDVAGSTLKNLEMGVNLNRPTSPEMILGILVQSAFSLVKSY
jgi:hypothetical protein